MEGGDATEGAQFIVATPEERARAHMAKLPVVVWRQSLETAKGWYKIAAATAKDKPGTAAGVAVGRG